MRVFLRFRRDRDRIRRIVDHVSSRSDPIPADLVRLVLILEDKRFLRHSGVDLVAGGRAIFHLLRGRPRGGASTIDMQLARTLTNYRARTATRKLYEILLAIAVRRSSTPEAVLTAYLNVAFMGKNMIGVDKAAQRLFGRCCAETSIEEQAQIAALLLYPMPSTQGRKWRSRLLRRARYALCRCWPHGQAKETETGLVPNKSEPLAELISVELPTQ
jgi:monofunctional glycosyltransferase